MSKRFTKSSIIRNLKLDLTKNGYQPHCKCFEPEGISKLQSEIQLKTLVVQSKKEVVGDSCFDNLSKYHLQSYMK